MDPRIRIHTKMSWIRNTGWDSGNKLGCSLAGEQEGLNKKILTSEQMWALLYPKKNTLDRWCKILNMFYISVFITRITKVEPRHWSILSLLFGHHCKFLAGGGRVYQNRVSHISQGWKYSVIGGRGERWFDRYFHRYYRFICERKISQKIIF